MARERTSLPSPADVDSGVAHVGKEVPGLRPLLARVGGARRHRGAEFLASGGPPWVIRRIEGRGSLAAITVSSTASASALL